ncbi:MAG: PLP-dependent aminotransferase family protein [Clostridia bacterium]|nr:PLP-dependent aminotransferase family protein [Clostridia bacterium]
MKYLIDRESTVPIYLQLYAQLKKDVVEGVCPYGARLPSKRTLAEKLGISVIPVEHALTLLCDEGYAEARERSGVFVIYRRDDFITPPVLTALPETEAGSPLPPAKKAVGYVFPLSVLTKKMRKVMLDRGEALLIKSPNRGLSELRTAITSYLRRSNGILADPSQIVIGSGAEYLYSTVLQLLGRGRTFALEDPSYEKIEKVYEANGVTVEKLPLAADGIRSDALAKSEATVLHVTPFNSFPSGVTASASKRTEYLSWARTRSGFVIEDNYDSELTVSRKNEDTLFATDGGKHVIYLNTFSKTVAPSVRVGYMILPRNLVGEFDRKLGFYSCTVPVFEQYLLCELLESGDFERHVNRVRRQKRKG